MQELFTTSCDWKVASMGWMYTLFFVLLGIAAAVWGGWLERVGPRKAGFVSALCWCGGLFLGAIGVYTHQLWLLWLGSGVIGGVGLGLGYISPVSTLVKWFPDRRGMATGMAIMGFGGGAMIGAPLANLLMNYFKTPTSVGVWETFVAMGVIYFVFMMIGAFRYRLPPPGWQPEGWTPPVKANAMISKNNVHLNDAHKTPQFWLIWWVLCLNVSAGIGVIGMASPMLQEIFGGKLIGLPDVGFNALDAGQKAQIAAIAAGFAGLLSLFNIGGRFFWASLSDKIGRKNTYYTFFILGIVLYALAPTFAAMGSKLLFVLGFGIILSMYGGGFATVPALSGRHVRHPVRRRHPWTVADGVVDCGHHRSGRGQLHPRVPARGRRAARPALQHHHVHPVRDVDRGPDLQLSGQAGRFEVAHEGRRCRQVAGGERQRCSRGAARLLWHRLWRARRQGGAVLGFRRRSLGLGCLEDAGERGQDFLIARSSRAGAHHARAPAARFACFKMTPGGIR
ncbi:MFS family permease [Bradyrhizobium sp. USDA 377]